MPMILVENVAPASQGLGMLPFFRDMEDGFAPGRHVRGADGAWIPPRPRLPLFNFPTRPLPMPMPNNGGFLPPWLRDTWAQRRGIPVPPASTMMPPILLPLPPVNTGPLPPPSPVVIVDHANPGTQEPPVGVPASTPAPLVPVVGAPGVSTATASMFAAPSAGASMFANSGAPTANSMFGTVQGSGSQVAKVSLENALSGFAGVPEPQGGGTTLSLVLLGGLALLTWWGFHLNEQAAPKRRAAR